MKNIYDIQGNVLMQVPVTPECEHAEELMRTDEVRMFWNAAECVVIPAGAYVEVPESGEKYYLVEPYKPIQRKENMWRYEPVFVSAFYALSKVPFYMYTYEGSDPTGQITSREADWVLTDNPANFMSTLCRAIKNETGDKYTYAIGADLAASATVTFNSLDIISALNAIANAFKTEFWLEKFANPDSSGNVGRIHLGFANDGATPKVLTVGTNINVPSVSDGREGFYNRFVILGSTRNITQEYRGANVNSIANKRLTLDPTAYPGGYIDYSDGAVYTKILVFDGVYPAANLRIKSGSVLARLRYVLDENGDRIEIQPGVYSQYAIYYFKLEKYENGQWSDFVFNNTDYDPVDNPSGMRLPNQKVSIHFSSGPLMGREFELEYHEDALVNVQDKADEFPFSAPAGSFEIVKTQEGDYIIPALTGLVPGANDEVILFNIMMPETYVVSAQDRLEAEAFKEIGKNYLQLNADGTAKRDAAGNLLRVDKNSYQFTSNPVAFNASNPGLKIASAVTYVNGAYSLATRVKAIVTKLDYPIKQTITVGEELTKGTIEELKDNAANANDNINLLDALSASTQRLLDAYNRTQEFIQAGLADDYFELNETLTTLVQLKAAYQYLGAKNGVFFAGASMTGTPEPDLYVKVVGEGANQQRVLYSPLALITAGDQIIGSGTPGQGGEGGGASYIYELKDTLSSWIGRPSVSEMQVLVFDPSSSVHDKNGNNGAWKYVNASSIGGVTSVVGQTGVVTAAQIATALTSAGYKLTDHEYSNGYGLDLSNGEFSLTQAVRDSLGLANTALQAASIKTLTLKVGTTTIGSAYNPIGSSNQTLTIAEANLTALLNDNYHPLYGEHDASAEKYFWIGGAKFVWHPAVGGTDGYLELQSAIVTTGDQIVNSGTPGGGGSGGGAGYLYELGDIYHDNDKTVVLRPNGQQRDNGDVLSFDSDLGVWVALPGNATQNWVSQQISALNLGTAATYGVASSVSQNDNTHLVTGAAVWTAIDNLPEPMVFKGSLGVGGTIQALPVNGSASIGDTYKVITAGTYAGKTAKVGDTFICDSKGSSTNTWTLIPSGDEPEGTVTSVGISLPVGLALGNGSTNPITAAGAFNIEFSSGYSIPLTADVTKGVTAYGYFDASGNAKSALKLTTVNKSAWGQTYWTPDGVPTSISGDMSSVGNVTPSDNKSKNLGSSTALWAKVYSDKYYLTDSVYFYTETVNNVVCVHLNAPFITDGDQIVISGTPGSGGGGGMPYMRDIQDVSLSVTVGNGDLLQWNGSAWVNVAANTVGVTTLASASAPGLMSSADYSKLAGIASGATNVTEDTVSGWGFTKNAGTVTSVKVGSTSYNPSSGVVSLPEYPSTLDDIADGSTRKLSNYVLKAGDTMTGDLIIEKTGGGLTIRGGRLNANADGGYIYLAARYYDNERNGVKIAAVYPGSGAYDIQDLVFYSSNNRSGDASPIWQEAMRIASTKAVSIASSLSVGTTLSVTGDSTMSGALAVAQAAQITGTVSSYSAILQFNGARTYRLTMNYASDSNVARFYNITDASPQSYGDLTINNGLIYCVGTSRVGIGTGSPSSSFKLDVNGDANASGKIYIGGTSGACLEWVPNGGNGYLKINRPLLTEGDQIVNSGTPGGGGGGGGAGFLYELGDVLTDSDHTVVKQYNGTDNAANNNLFAFNGSKWYALKLGSNLAISSGTLNATNTTYSNGTGLSLSNGVFSITTAYQTDIANGASAYSTLTTSQTKNKVFASPSNASGAPSFRTLVAADIPAIENLTNFSTKVYDASTSRTANYVLAAPNGSNGAATFRALVAADIPSLAISKITNLQTTLDGKQATISDLATIRSNATNGQAAYNALGNYVLKAGDTMSGDLIIEKTGGGLTIRGGRLNANANGGYIYLAGRYYDNDRNGVKIAAEYPGSVGYDVQDLVIYTSYNLSGNAEPIWQEAMRIKADKAVSMNGSLSISRDGVYSIYINNTASDGTASGIRFQLNGTTKGGIFVSSDENLYYSSGTSSTGSKVLTASNYDGYALPLAGGTMTGSIKLTNGTYINAASGYAMCGIGSGGDTFYCGPGAEISSAFYLRSGNINLTHVKAGTNYTIWDGSNAGTSTTPWTCSTLTTNGNVTMYESSSHTYRWTLNFNSAVGRLYAINDAGTEYNDILINNTITVTSGFNVGIGTASPSYKLHVSGTTGFASGHLYLTGAVANSSTANTTQIVFGTSSSNHVVISSNTDAVIINPTTGTTTGQIVLGVNATSSTFGNSVTFNGPANRFVSDTWTNVGIKRAGTGGAWICFYPSNQETYFWDVGAGGVSSNSTNFSFEYQGNGVKAYLTPSGTFSTVGDQVISSDINLKTNLQDVTYSVEDIAKTRAVTFDWKDGRGKSAGSIAQDWMHLVPQLVHGEEGHMTLAYGQIAMLNTILLARRSEDHETRIKALELENAELRKEIERLKS